MDMTKHYISTLDIEAMRASARRPEVVDIAQRLKTKHPLWDMDRCITEAKHQIISNRY